MNKDKRESVLDRRSFAVTSSCTGISELARSRQVARETSTARISEGARGGRPSHSLGEFLLRLDTYGDPWPQPGEPIQSLTC